MKKAVLMGVMALAVMVNVADARKLSTMEWVDQESMATWQSLSEQDKVDSVKSYLAQQSGENQAALEAKVKTCLDKEVADPDYKGLQVPLMIPLTYCMTKYSTILSSQKK